MPASSGVQRSNAIDVGMVHHIVQCRSGVDDALGGDNRLQSGVKHGLQVQ